MAWLEGERVAFAVMMYVWEHSHGWLVVWALLCVQVGFSTL